MNAERVVTGLAALAHPVRLEVFRALVIAGERGLTPGVMQAALRVPAATLSFHLRQLVDSGLVTQARSGRHLIHRVDRDQNEALLGYLAEHCRAS